MPLSQQKQEWVRRIRLIQSQHETRGFVFKWFAFICLIALAAVFVRFILFLDGILLGIIPFLFIGITISLYLSPKYARCAVDLLRIEVAVVKDDPKLLDVLREDFVCFKDLEKVLYGNRPAHRPAA
jgi:hypothetical protein